MACDHMYTGNKSVHGLVTVHYYFVTVMLFPLMPFKLPEI